MKYNLLMYDFEVFTGADFWCVVIIDYETRNKTIIKNDKTELKNFYDLHKNDIWVGYNSRNYDQFILKSILLNENPFKVNDEIIVKGKKGYQVIKKANTIKFNNFDIATGFHSLKQLEGFMGSRIKETSIPFDIQRKLTDIEIDEVIEYCIHDVEETIKVFDYRKEEFNSQLSLIEAFELDMSMFNKTKAQLSAHILGAVKQHSIDDEFDFQFPPTLKLDKYKYVFDWYMNPRNRTYGRKGEPRQFNTKIADVDHTFAFGGLHGARENYTAEGIILCADVGSMYPAIMIEYDLLSRNMRNPSKYREIRDKRLELKANKNPMQKPYKIVLNSTYGILKDKNNALYDPCLSNSVCITGQLLLLDLVEKIEPYCEIIQTNTDGVYMLVENMETVDKIKNIAKEWETRSRLTLEWDIYSKIYQRDVNNYIIIDKNGHFKSKGCVKKLNPIDYDLPIIRKAVIDYCVSNTPVEETINNCDDLIEFQKIVKITHLYKYAMYGDKPLEEKVLRVFASSDENAKGVFKVKSKNKIEKIANTPDKCFIDNENVIGKKIPTYLDKEYYIKLAKETLSDFIHGKEKKQTTNDKIIEIINETNNYNNFHEVLKYIKNETTIGYVTLNKYIMADMFNKYGNVKKLLNYIECFKALHKKVNPKQKTLMKTIDDMNIFNIMKKHCESYDEDKQTFKKLDSETCLLEIWDYLPNEDIDVVTKLRQQYSLFEDVTSIDENCDIRDLYIINVNDTKNPSIVAYCMKTGITQFLKIDKDVFNVLKIYEDDVVKAKTFEQRCCQKVVGKDNNGVNILEDDDTRFEWWLTSYDIIDRDYSENKKLIIDDENEE